MWNVVVSTGISLLVLFNGRAVFGQGPVLPAFFDTPPSGYSERLTLRDCAARFYANVGDFTGPFGGLGGFRVRRGEFQHMAAIGWTRSSSRTDYLCGGSLITKQFVMTAAHCAWDSEGIAPDTVRIGDTDLGSPEDDAYAQQIAIVRFTNHPQYRESRKYFDIAIVELQRAAEYTEAVCNACLWREEEVPGERMDAIGFGATGFGEKLSPTLQRVELDAINLTSCATRILISSRQMPDGFRQDQFCAAGSTMDTCEGDSGGPIGVKRFDVGGRLIPLVAGVVSFGTPCAIGSTGVYTKVSSYMNWIEQETNTSFAYPECARTSFCPGRRSEFIPVNFDNNYANNRFGLLWDDAAGSSLYECGATLIDDQFLLTLASCVTSSRGAPKFVAYDSKERVAVTDVYVSPKYRPGSPESNIALVKIEKYVNTNMFRPACLWDRKIDGEWSSGSLHFGAYGAQLDYGPVERFRNDTIFVKADHGKKCTDLQKSNESDVVCYTNRVNLMPSVCAIDHGAPVINGSIWGEPVFAYGLVSTLSKDCASNLFLTDVSPHIGWIESIIIGKRDQFLVFTD